MPSAPYQIKFKPEIVDEVLDKISKNIPYKVACLSSGVSERNFYLWRDKGERDLFEFKDTPHAEFVRRLAKIEAKKIQYNAERIESNENGHKGAQYILEKVFWKYFSPRGIDMELNERLEALEKKQGVVNDECETEEQDSKQEEVTVKKGKGSNTRSNTKKDL